MITRKVFASSERAVLVLGVVDGLVRLGEIGNTDALIEMTAEDAIGLSLGLRDKALACIRSRKEISQ